MRGDAANFTGLFNIKLALCLQNQIYEFKALHAEPAHMPLSVKMTTHLMANKSLIQRIRICQNITINHFDSNTSQIRYLI